MITSVGQNLTPLQPLGLLAVRQPSRGPLGVPVGTTAEEAEVTAAATAADWQLEVVGPRPYRLSLSDLESRATHEASFPVGALEGWGVDAQWRGLSLLEVVEEAGGNAESRVRVTSLEVASLGRSQVFGPQLAVALLATHLNGERLPSRSRLSPAPDRSQSRRGPEHEVAHQDRGAVMRAWRVGLGIAGIVLVLIGISRLLTYVPPGHLAWLGVWLIAALIIHEGVLSPVVVAIGAGLRRLVPDRARRYLQAALIMAAVVSVIAVPLIIRQGSQPVSKAMLLQNYGANLALLLGLIGAVILILYAIRVARDRTPAPPR